MLFVADPIKKYASCKGDYFPKRKKVIEDGQMKYICFAKPLK
jgi:hypothetical protein